MPQIVPNSIWSLIGYKKMCLLIVVVLLLNGTLAQQDILTENQAGTQNQNQQQFRQPSTTSQQVRYTQQNQRREMSVTDKQRLQEQEGITQFYKTYPMVELFNQFSFQVSNAYEEFHFHLPTDLTIHFLIRIYVLKNNAYNQVQNIENEPALHVIVYENNHRIMVQKSFYYQSGVTVNGKGGSTYMIRFYSPSHKLVIVTHNKFVQSSHFEGKVKNEQMKEYNNRLNVYGSRLSNIFKLLKTTYRIQFQQRSLITQKFSKFSTFEILEMIIVVLMCVVQVRVVNKMFRSDSII